MPGIEIPDLWWKVYLSALGWIFLSLGAVLWIRAVLTLGADNLAMLYVYHPESGRLVDTQVYGLLRHPIYSGVLRVVIGLCLLNGNWPALIFALLAPLGLLGWVRLVEERELLVAFSRLRRLSSARACLLDLARVLLKLLALLLSEWQAV